MAVPVPVRPGPAARPAPRRRWPWFLCLPPIAVLAAAWPCLLPPIRGGPAAAAASPHGAPPVAAPAAGDGPESPCTRTPVDAAAPAASTFAEFVERLVAIGIDTSRLDAAGDREGAEASDRSARDEFAAMLQQLPDAECEALAALADHGEPPADDVPGRLRRQVWNLTLRVGLERRHRTALAAPARRPALDTLVAATLTALPAGDALAHELAEGQLANRPYLAAVHEPAVLDLVARSGERRFPADVAEALLTTLWHNLQADGERGSEQLAALALALLHDGNESERRAAAKQLVRDDRWRAVVLQHLRAQKDRALARELALVAAQELPPATAIEVIATAAAVGADTTAPFLVLGHRDVGALRQAYEQRLAADVDPELRNLLVAGGGFAGTPEGIELARLALDSDPDADVRLRAVFALTASAGASLGEAAVARALDDSRISADPQRLGALVLALDNQAQQGLANALDRLGQRLRLMPALTPAARADLERILARALPGGRTSR
jgi:hypothetical protein